MNNTIRNIIWVFVSIVVSKGMGIATAFFIPKILGPADFGIWVAMLAVLQYAPIACLGTGEALIRLFPYHYARDEFEKAREIEDGVLGSIIIGSAFILIFGLIFTNLVVMPGFQNVLPMVKLMILSASVSLFSAFYSLRLVAHQKFKCVGLTETLRSFVTFVLLVSFSYAWSLKGSVFGYLISEILLCALLVIISTFACGKISVKFSFQSLLKLVKVGLPITLVWWVYILQTTAGSLISMAFLGDIPTGYFGLGVSISSILILIPDAVNRVLYPRINEEVGRGGGYNVMERLVIMPGFIIGLFGALLIGVLVLFLPYLYFTVFQRYLPGLLCGKILLLGAFFSCLVRSGANFLIANNEIYLLLKYVIVGLGTNVLLNIIFIKAGFGIAGVAFGTAIASIIVTTIIWISVFRVFGKGKVERWKELYKLYSPFIIALVLISIEELFIKQALLKNSFQVFLVIGVYFAMFISISYFIPIIRGVIKEVYSGIKMNMVNRPL
jgi:O-antigen/teichoic acid export membrane protein